MKLFLAFLAHGVLFVGGPYFMEQRAGGVAKGHLALLIIVWLGIALKFLVGDLVSGHFDYEKHGYDLCLISMGGALSALAVQLFIEHETLPGLKQSVLAPFLKEISGDGVRQQIVFLVVVFLGCCCASLLAASINRGIANTKNRLYKSVKTLASFAIGGFTFVCYLFLVLWKVATP